MSKDKNSNDLSFPQKIAGVALPKLVGQGNNVVTLTSYTDGIGSATVRLTFENSQQAKSACEVINKKLGSRYSYNSAANIGKSSNVVILECDHAERFIKTCGIEKDVAFPQKSFFQKFPIKFNGIVPVYAPDLQPEETGITLYERYKDPNAKKAKFNNNEEIVEVEGQVNQNNNNIKEEVIKVEGAENQNNNENESPSAFLTDGKVKSGGGNKEFPPHF